ncbi:unnamed protein product [Adineta ricciae]|uniref:Uncharacterized protein n=1 Tax=Adineta ricciae TaxID=249248 RepID=A0A813ZVF3_ADIRI|nr:unnamed protein product [Adineta ricciae]
MHNKTAAPIECDDANRSMRKSKSASNPSTPSKKKVSSTNLAVKIETDDNDTKLDNDKLSPTGCKTNGNTSPSHRRRPKRSSINNHSLLSTVASVHELMSFVIYKDNPPSWLKQTDLYKEYLEKSEKITMENNSSMSPPHFHQQVHRKQRCNLQMYARSDQSWPLLSSSLSISPTVEQRVKMRNRSSESLHKTKRETNISPIHSSVSMTDLSVPLNISIKQDPIEQNSLLNTNKTKSLKQTPSVVTTRRQQMLCKKKTPQNGLRRRRRMNSVENQEPSEHKNSSSSSQNDSNTSITSSSSSIEHASPSPTTTVSRSSSHNSSSTECMRGSESMNTRYSSPLRIQTSISPQLQSLSTPQRRSTRIWAPSSFYINPMWILPSAGSTPSKRLLVQNTSSSPSPPSESNKRPRRRCRS